MKKAMTRALAGLLVLLTLAAGTTVAGAAPALRGIPVPGAGTQAADTIEITAWPSPSVYVYRWGSDTPDLSGLKFTASGAGIGALNIEYDEVMSSAYIMDVYKGRLSWYFDVSLDWDAQPEGWRAGVNQAVLLIYATKFTDFVVEYTAPNGKEYGYFKQEFVFEASKPVTITGIIDSVLDPAFENAALLELDKPADVSIPEPPEDEEREAALFKFTPAASGYYTFSSLGAQPGMYEPLYTEDGEWLDAPGVAPEVYIYDEFGFYVDDGYGYGGRELRLRTCLEGGKTYYLRATAWPYGDYTLTVTRFDARLKVNAAHVTVYFHDYVGLEALLAGTTWDLDDLYFSYDAVTLRNGWEGLYGYQNGTGRLTIHAPDGSQETVSYRVTYSFRQWLYVIFLGGFYWMKWTSIGPFDFNQQWRHLLDYGIGNGLFDALSDLGLPYWMIAWLVR